MKKEVKRWLYDAGFLNLAQHVYFNAKTFSPRVLWREFYYKQWDAPDGFSIPPANLIYDVIACRWGSVYYDSGERLVEEMEGLLEKNHRPLTSFGTVLDFGCGSGRLIRHVHRRTSATLYGSDYNATLIDWCQRHLPFAHFSKNELVPPLSFADETFDFIYARSVFTHLPEDLQKQWIRELHRVLKPGGCLYLTMHGQRLAEGLNEAQRSQFEAGELVVTYASFAGENLCSTYASSQYVKKKLLDGFTLLDFDEGHLQKHLRQDVYLFQKV